MLCLWFISDEVKENVRKNNRERERKTQIKRVSPKRKKKREMVSYNKRLPHLCCKSNKNSKKKSYTGRLRIARKESGEEKRRLHLRFRHTYHLVLTHKNVDTKKETQRLCEHLFYRSLSQRKQLLLMHDGSDLCQHTSFPFFFLAHQRRCLPQLNY